MTDKSQDQLNQEMKERAMHQAVLSDIQTLLATKSGKNFVKYLFQSFDVGEVPVFGATGDYLQSYLGMLRAGNSIFKIVSEANPDVAGALLAQIEKERHAALYT